MVLTLEIGIYECTWNFDHANKWEFNSKRDVTYEPNMGFEPTSMGLIICFLVGFNMSMVTLKFLLLQSHFVSSPKLCPDCGSYSPSHFNQNINVMESHGVSATGST